MKTTRPLILARNVMAFAMSLVLIATTCAVVPVVALAASKPAKPTISSATSKSAGAVKVVVKKTKRAKGYQYRVGTNKKLTKNTASAMSKSRKVTLTGLKAGKKYYIKVRAYSGSASKPTWGKWSKAKKVKVKKDTKHTTVAGVEVDSPYAKFNSATATALKEGVKLDYSNARYGYVGAQGTKGRTLKLLLVKGSKPFSSYGSSSRPDYYQYNLSTNGKAAYCPLNMGNGTYTAEVLRQTSSGGYMSLGSGTFDASMMNAYQPFMHNNVYVSYSSGSTCVKQAASICKGKSSDTARVSAIYKKLTKRIKYDKKKAKSVQNGYIPDPDKTWKSKKGICFDYASLAAAMMRSQGVPCRVITGYVSKNTYHAWNMIYLKNSGWITAEIKADTNDWERIDITFAATGASNSFIGNGKNYSDPKMMY